MSKEAIFTKTGAHVAGARIKQLSIFIGDRLGALHRALTLLDEDRIRICALSILDGADHAVVRLVVDRPDLAVRLLEADGCTVYVRDLLGVALPHREDRDVGIREALQTLLSAEVKVAYVYSLVVTLDQRSILALNVEDMELAERAITGFGLELVDQEQLGWGSPEA